MALYALTSKGLVSAYQGDKAIEEMAKFFAAHRRGSILHTDVAARYRSAMGAMSDMRRALQQFSDRVEEHLRDYADKGSCR